jgi:hypothetical protein
MEQRRRQGLGSWLILSVLEHPDLEHLKKLALITHDAQTFYLGLDFRFTSDSNFYMERLQIGRNPKGRPKESTNIYALIRNRSYHRLG